MLTYFRTTTKLATRFCSQTVITTPHGDLHAHFQIAMDASDPFTTLAGSRFEINEWPFPTTI